jgi:hypothetical protein
MNLGRTRLDATLLDQTLQDLIRDQGSPPLSRVGLWPGVGVSEPRSRGLPRSGLRPAVDGGWGRGNKGFRIPVHGDSRGEGFSPLAQAEHRELP